MTLGIGRRPTCLGVVDVPQNLWITFPQPQCLGVMDVPWTSDFSIGPEKSGGHLGHVWGSFRKVWGSPMTPHHIYQPLPLTTRVAEFSKVSTDSTCGLWMNSIEAGA